MIFGIDPGLSGAYAVVMADGSAKVMDTPTVTWETSKGGKIRRHRHYHVGLMNSGLLEIYAGPRGINDSVHAFIEKAQPMPEQGVTSTFSIGYGYGLWVAILVAAGIPFTEIRPWTWKKLMFQDFGANDKAASLARARQLFPHVDLHLKQHEGRAEALLIAEYGRRLLSATPPTGKGE